MYFQGDPAMPKERILTAQEQKFVRLYVKHRDVAKAAGLCRMKPEAGKRFMKRQAVAEDIARWMSVIQKEQVDLDLKEANLENALLDSELKKVIMLDAKEHGALKLNAITLGFIVTGRMRDGQREAVGLKQEQAPLSGGLYQQMFSHKTTHVVETTAVQQQQMAGAPVPEPPHGENAIIRVY